ncbi:hypothetical protein LWI29_019009 [Acer saccharum]|uniref:Uncharacterized protein n=1 Tax=Acer saccharum TaxID=4024 RepID=A0AA39TFP5_ACESA|nr:hypothetical protein LWI29_019009 [Acer saccharum]
MELFIGPQRHQPFDQDGTIPSNHLHNFEHATISLTFLTYASFAIVLDRIGSKTQHALTQFIGSIAFAQQLLIFHLHSADHMGVEGQYHLLLQLVIFVSFTTTIIGIGLPKSFLISFVRSTSILFQGAWLILMGYMLWTPQFVPKGCYINREEGHQVMRCHGEQALHRAKALVNLQFSWFLVGITIFSLSFYLVWDNFFTKKVEYSTLTREEDDDSDDVEYQKRGKYATVTPNVQQRRQRHGDGGCAATTAMRGTGGFPSSSSSALTTTTPSSSLAALHVAVIAATATVTRRATEELEGVVVVRAEEDDGNLPVPHVVVIAAHSASPPSLSSSWISAELDS